MRNIWLLLKNYLICGVGNLRRKNTRTKAVVGVTIIAAICVAYFAFWTWTMCEMAAAMAELNMQASVLVLGLVISIFISLMLALQKVTGGQKANDTELLLSMPFKKIEIMIAKALSRFAANLWVVVMFFVPSIIGYMLNTPFSLPALFGCLVVLLLVPLFGVGLSYVVDYIVTVCFSNSKAGNIAKAIVTLIVLVGAVSIYEFFSFNISSPMMPKTVQWMITFNPLVMLPLIVGVLALFLLGNWLNALLLNRETRTKPAKAVEISKNSISPFMAILKNENNRYFNSPTMMLNTLMGPLGLIGITIWTLFDRNMVSSMTAMFGVSVEVGYLIVAIALSALTILTYPAAFSISLEGKQLWILRSMPIPAHTVLNAKVLFNILLVSPISILCSVVLQIVLGLSPINFLAFLVLPVLCNVLVSYAGVFINLCFPKLEFESEATVIKQSMSSFIMMFGGLLVVGGLVAAAVGLAGILPFAALAAVVTGILAVLVATFAILTYTLGQRMFNRL